jgi:hypothetical protein
VPRLPVDEALVPWAHTDDVDALVAMRNLGISAALRADEGRPFAEDCVDWARHRTKVEEPQILDTWCAAARDRRWVPRPADDLVPESVVWPGGWLPGAWRVVALPDDRSTLVRALERAREGAGEPEARTALGLALLHVDEGLDDAEVTTVLLAMGRETPREPAVHRALAQHLANGPQAVQAALTLQRWAPYDPLGYVLLAEVDPDLDARGRERLLRRASVLSPTAPRLAVRAAQTLVAGGETLAAMELRAALPDVLVTDAFVQEILLAIVQAGEGRVHEALGRAVSAQHRRRGLGETNLVEHAGVDLIVQLSTFLRRGPETVDPLVRTFVFDRPDRSRTAAGTDDLVTLCLYASRELRARCAARLADDIASGAQPLGSAATQAVLDALRLHHDGDASGAVEALGAVPDDGRRLAIAALLRELERPDLAAAVELRGWSNPVTIGGHGPDAAVRALRLAEAGRRDEARALVDDLEVAWSGLGDTGGLDRARRALLEPGVEDRSGD